MPRRAPPRDFAFDFLCLGISEAANTRALFERAASLGTRFVLDVDMETVAAEQAIRDFVAECDAIYCTFCLDVLPPAVAPAVSAPAGLGMTLQRAIGLLRLMHRACSDDSSGRGKLVMADIAEYSPPHDTPDGRTGRTAARIVYELASAQSVTSGSTKHQPTSGCWRLISASMALMRATASSIVRSGCMRTFTASSTFGPNCSVIVLNSSTIAGSRSMHSR